MKFSTTTLKSACLSAVAGVLAIGTVSAQDTEFKPSSNLWGYTFGDVYVKAHADSMGRGAGNVTYKGQPMNQTSFQLRRTYIGWDYNFAKNFSTQIVLANELQGTTNATGYSSTDQFGQNTTYLKYAYLKWSNIFPMSNLVIGQIPTNSFASNTEQLMGYRNLERTILDLHNFDSSTDLGLGLNGKLWKGKGEDSTKPAFIGYSVVVGNNNGAKNQTDANLTAGTPTGPLSTNNGEPFNSFKKTRINIFESCMHNQLTVGIYGDYVRTAFALSNPVTGLATYKPETENYTFKAYANYSQKWFSVGAEYFMFTAVNGDVYKANGAGNTIYAANKQNGFSVWASGTILPSKLNAFARMDIFNPNANYSSTNVYSSTYTSKYNEGYSAGATLTSNTFYKQTLYIFGLDYTPTSRVHIMPNVWYNQYDAMSSNMQNLTNNVHGLAKSDYDLVYRVTFHYIFNSSKSVNNNGRGN